MKLFLVILLVGSTLVAAQEPKRCETPPSWHAHVSRSEVDFGGRTSIRGRLNYDETDQRISILEQYEFRNPQSDYSFGRYFFYKPIPPALPEPVEYRANFTTKTCEKRRLLGNSTFRPFSIPYNAQYIDTVEIGSNVAPGDGVEVYIWGGQTLEGGFFTTMYTTKDCIPVLDEYNRGPFFASTIFYDVEGGFNPDYFVVPSYCF